MNSLHPAGPIIGLVVALLCLWWSLRQRRRHRLLNDLPTSKIHGVFIGLVELKGTVECPAPLTSYLAGAACIHYAWKVEEHYRRTRTETYTDSKGNTKTRTVTDTGWETVASDDDLENFLLRDDTGFLLVRPEGATIEPQSLFDETVSRGHPLYYGKGPDSSVYGSTGSRRFTEQGIPVGATLYVLGTARERADIVAPEITAARGSEFIVSCRSEDAIKRGFALGSWATWIAGLVALPAGLYFGCLDYQPPAFVTWCILAASGWAFVWFLGWVWMVHDSLISLRARVRQGWSLIEVQLKRRHDLIPALTASVAAIATHEKETQTALAALRTQLAATAPGVAGPDFAGLAVTLRAVVERYPALTADASFAALQTELIQTEQRIALARAYYNDIATHYATRLEIIPDRFVAALRALRPRTVARRHGF